MTNLKIVLAYVLCWLFVVLVLVGAGYLVSKKDKDPREKLAEIEKKIDLENQRHEKRLDRLLEQHEQIRKDLK